MRRILLGKEILEGNYNYPVEQYSRDYIEELVVYLIQEINLTKILIPFPLTCSKELKESSAGIVFDNTEQVDSVKCELSNVNGKILKRAVFDR